MEARIEVILEFTNTTVKLKHMPVSTEVSLKYNKHYP